LGWKELKGALALAIKASGLGSMDRWFKEGDIHMAGYRFGAMADTVATLLLAEPLFDLAVDRQLNHPFSSGACTDRAQASALILQPQEVNRITLRRAAMGYEVDLGYLANYVDTVEIDRERAKKVVSDAGLRPGIGKDIVSFLEREGSLPANWPRTKPSKTFPQGQWKTDKDAIALLPDHPLALAHQKIAHTDKILGYMEKTAARSRVTGRLHPQWHILGASATGRMACTEPPLQQFPKEARPIILCDEGSNGLESIDWSSVEPALLGNMAHDWDFITPFEQGADIYEPVMAATGTVRKTSKTIVLARMYGQGRDTLAIRMKMSTDQVDELHKQMYEAMPVSSEYMDTIKGFGNRRGLTLTVAANIWERRGNIADS